MLKEAVRDFSIVEEVRHAFLGKVLLVEHSLLKNRFFLIELDHQFIEPVDHFEKMARILPYIAKIDHPHILKIHDTFFYEGKWYLAYDASFFAENGWMIPSLYFSSCKDFEFEDDLAQFSYQLASALDYAKSLPFDKPFYHGGLNLNNILVKKDGSDLKTYLLDFGIASVFSSDFYLAHLQKRQESSSYDSFNLYQAIDCLAPEQKTSAYQPGDKIDAYAFGAVLYYLLKGHFPYGLDVDLSFESQKLDWAALLKDCLQFDPEKRSSSLTSALRTHLLREKNRLSFKEEEIEKSISKKLNPVLKPTEITRPTFDADPGSIFQTELSIGPYLTKPFDSTPIAPLLTKMKVIEGGTFLRGSLEGSRDETPSHKVILNPYAIDIHPVSNEQFILFLEAMGGEKDNDNHDIIRLKDSRIKKVGGRLIVEAGYLQHPVVGVSWYGALAYAKWIGKRLPTEAEWEVAAYGGSYQIYPTGLKIDKTEANFFSSDTMPVMTYQPNLYGLYDMAGNVYEWCQDWYGYDYYETVVHEPFDPKGPLQGVYRVLRGGCWKSLKEDLRCAHRHRNNPGISNSTYGFRCAADVS